MTHRAAIFSDAVCEAAVAFCSDLNLIGALQKQSLLKVACGLIHVGNAVLAVICDVLGGLSGHKAQEGKLDVDILSLGAFTAIVELKKRFFFKGNAAYYSILSLKKHTHSKRIPTWKPSVIASPNQTCFFSLMFLLVYQLFLGMSACVG